MNTIMGLQAHILKCKMLSVPLVYAGIGSRDTPLAIQAKMTKIAQILHNDGWTLRSGGARGADKAFAAGTDRSEIFRPEDVTSEALELAAKYHPKWNKLDEKSRLLIARNGFQVLGRSLHDPSAFVICWTADGGPSGGTGQALRIAADREIAVYNLHNPNFFKVAK